MMSDEHLDNAIKKLRGWVANSTPRPVDLDEKLNLLLEEQERRLERNWARHVADETGDDAIFPPETD